MKIEKKNRIVKAWAVVWRNDPVNLALYRMKEPILVSEEWSETVGDKRAFNSYVLFHRRCEAENWRFNNKDWETVRCEITYKI